MCRQVSLIWSYSRFSSPRSKRFYAFIFASCKRVREIPHYWTATLCSEWAVRSSETKHGEKNIVVLALLCWLFMERIHPSFCALRVRAMRVGILGSGGSKRGNKPPPPKLPQTCWWTVRTASASGFWNTVLQSAHTHTYIYTKAHTENKQYFKRDSWPLSPPQVRLLTFLLRDKRLSAEWPTFSFFFLSDCTH